MPKTVIILNKNSTEPLLEQKEEMMAIATSLNLCNVTCYETIQDSYEVLESDNITILVQNLDSISSFYHDYLGYQKTSYIIPSPKIRFISINENIDVNLVDYRVIELLESLKTTYKMLEEYN